MRVRGAGNREREARNSKISNERGGRSIRHSYRERSAEDENA